MIAAPPLTTALARWVGMSGDRLSCLLHLMALAATLSAAKVILNTIGAALFLANEGPERLPVFYILLAAVVIVLSLAFTGVVDRLPRIRLAQAVFLGILVGAAALRLPIAFDVPGAYHALLAGAHIYEIVLEIVFWVVVATYLNAIELKRGAAYIFMALAAGGVAGGALTNGLSAVMPAEDLVLVLPFLGVVAVAQFAVAERSLIALDDHHGDEEETAGALANLALLPRLISRYPLILLIALNALMLTILYGLAEYLVFSVYAAEYPDERELTRFLAVIYALIQVLEFALLYTVSRPLLGRAGPLVRNLVFPLTSLGCLVGLAFGNKLPVAIAAHVNAEALSNTIFQPVYNTNFSALPVRFHGRVRTLADGIFYPAGLAVAGLLLLSVQDPGTELEVHFTAIVFALLFVALNVAVGLIFLPTLVRSLRSGVVDFTEVARRFDPLPPPVAEGVRDLLRSADPDARALGLRLAERVDPGAVLDDLRPLLPGADPATRRAIARLLARARPEAVEPLLKTLLASLDEGDQLVALQATLASGGAAEVRRIEPLTASSNRSVAAMAALAAIPPGAGAAAPGPAEALLALARDPDAYGAVVDAIAQARRADLVDALVRMVDAAPPERKPPGLAALREVVAPEHAGAADLARRLAAHGDPSVRAEAVGVLGALARFPGALDELGRALDDPNPRVRRRAAEALAARGDAAIVVVAARLSAAHAGAVEAAIWTLGRIGSRRARALLVTFVQSLHEQAARDLDWLRRLPPDRNRRAWTALEAAIHDHNLRTIHGVMDVLAALGEHRLVAQVRRALAATDQRTRANALEALLSARHRRYVVPILPLLEAVLVAPASDGPGGPVGTGTDDLLAEAAAATDPWVRVGAACVANGLRSDHPVAVAAPSPANDRGSTPSEDDMERVLALRRVPLFRYLPLDTLLAVSRMLERRAYVAGETIAEAGGRSEYFWMIESGTVEVVEGGRPAERLVAPAYFGELALADELTPSPRVVAIEDSVLLRLHRIVFHDLSRDHPDILMELCRLLAQRLRAGDRMPARTGDGFLSR